MAKSDAVYVEHMLDCIHSIDEYVESKESFYAEKIVQDAVIRNLQVLAESSQRLSQTLKDNYPEIPWKQISGFRNVLVHDYLGVDLDVIWTVIEQELPDLQVVLEELQAQ